MKILIAIDGSQCSKNAVESVATRLWHEGTEFLILSVVEPLSLQGGLWMPSEGPQEALIRQHELLVETEVVELRDKLPNQTISGKVMEGHIVDGIVLTAEEWDADFIIMGSHGRKGISRFMLGSVAESVLSHSPCSVEVIKGHKVPGEPKGQKDSKVASQT